MTWQNEIKNSLKDIKKCQKIFNNHDLINSNFSIKIPFSFIKLIDKNNINDPLFKQVIKSSVGVKKTAKQYNFTKDPTLDTQNMPVAGLVHKYHNRVLLIVSQDCAIHCRYCFRQNFSYKNNNALKNWHKVLNYLQDNKQINEVILSGGDPLNVSDKKILSIINDISSVKHINVIRIHSRTLVVVPSRITNKLVHIINNSTTKIVLVTHINHKQEISNEFSNKITNFKCLIFNQSVLLKNINDNADTLIALSNKLLNLNITPYYLHILDKAIGSEEFLVSNNEAKIIYKKMQKQLSGYLLPKLVQDDNLECKTIIA